MQITREMARESVKQCVGVWSVCADPFMNTLRSAGLISYSFLEPGQTTPRPQKTNSWLVPELPPDKCVKCYSVLFDSWLNPKVRRVWNIFLAVNSIWTVFEPVEPMMDIFQWFGWALCVNCMIIACLWTTLFVGVTSTKRTNIHDFRWFRRGL